MRLKMIGKDEPSVHEEGGKPSVAMNSCLSPRLRGMARGVMRFAQSPRECERVDERDENQRAAEGSAALRKHEE